MLHALCHYMCGIQVIVKCPEGHVTDFLSKYSILDMTINLMLLVVMLVAVVRRWTATCNTVVALFS